MGKIVSIANQKGGVGKTTTTVNLAASIGAKGKRVLLVDIDPQGNATSGFGVNKRSLTKSSYDLLIGSTAADEVILSSGFQNVDVLPSNIALAGAEIEIVEMDDRAMRLKNALAPVKNRYDFIFIDCPPSLGLITLNALAASDTLMVPIQCEYYALEGLSQLVATIRQVKRLYNPTLDLEGVLLTMYDGRLNLTMQVVAEVKKFFPQKVYKTTIPRNIRLSEAPSYGQPALYFDRNSKARSPTANWQKNFYRKIADNRTEKGGRQWLQEKGGLGKGLEALFIDNTTDNGPVTLRISEIEPNRGQPRKEFEESALADLADSIREHGVIQPLLVRPLPTGGYQLVAGERRWRASRMAGLSEVPVVIRELSDHETMELALIENLQRQDLNPMEEALGYQSLMEEYQMTQEEVSKVIGKSRPAIANSLRLLALPQPVVRLIEEGKLSAGHGRALLALENEASILEAAQLAVKKQLSVREMEKLARSTPKSGKSPAKKEADRYYTELELALTQTLGRQVTITAKGKSQKLSVEFFDKEDLSALVKRLCGDEEIL